MQRALVVAIPAVVLAAGLVALLAPPELELEPVTTVEAATRQPATTPLDALRERPTKPTRRAVSTEACDDPAAPQLHAEPNRASYTDSVEFHLLGGATQPIAGTLCIRDSESANAIVRRHRVETVGVIRLSVPPRFRYWVETDSNRSAEFYGYGTSKRHYAFVPLRVLVDVRGPDGRPRAGVRVGPVWPDGSRGHHLAFSDARGRCVLEFVGLDGRAFIVRSLPPSPSSDQVRIDPSRGDRLRVRLNVPATGTVVVPIASAFDAAAKGGAVRVRLARSTGNRADEIGGRRTPRGVVFEGLALGVEYEVRVAVPGGVMVGRATPHSARRPARLELRSDGLLVDQLRQRRR